jgi:hypothetical protein
MNIWHKFVKSLLKQKYIILPLDLHMFLHEAKLEFVIFQPNVSNNYQVDNNVGGYF